MKKEICAICKRVKAGTESGPDKTASHGYCARCMLGYEGMTLVPLDVLIKKENREDPKVKDALKIVKECIREDLESGVKWIGEEIEYSEEAEKIYQELLKEAETEIANEAGREINKK